MAKKRKPRNDKNHIVYLITNIETEQRYIGITFMRGQAVNSSMKIRWEGHLNGAFKEQRTYTFPTHLRQYAPVVKDDIKWGQAKKSYVRKLRKTFKMELLEVVRGSGNAHKREVELINALQPELNDKKQRVA